MTAIKEYPFDLSDLQNQPKEEEKRKTSGSTNRSDPPQYSSVRSPTPDGKRKVSIMADESSKDRENLPSERSVYKSNTLFPS